METIDEPTNVVTLCGVQGCCPTVAVSTSEVVFRDDFGGKVTLTPAEWADLVHKVKQGELV